MTISGSIHRSMDLVTCAAVTHRETERAIQMSSNGDRSTARWFPKSQIIFEAQTPKPFVAISLSKRLAKEKTFSIHNSRLTDTKKWTKEQRAAWALALSTAASIRNDARKPERQQAIGPLAGRNHYA